MAKLPKVKCKYCGVEFQRENEPFVKISNRYAHQECYEKHIAAQSKEERDKEELFDYLKKLFGEYNYPMTNRLLEKYIKENNYTYSGIRKTLHYFYIIRKNPIEKANGSIGIVPYVYEEAKRYYMGIAQANEKNAKKEIKKENPLIKVIRITSPQRDKKKKHKLFKFLDEGED